MFCKSALRCVFCGPYMYGAFSEILFSHERRFFFRLLHLLRRSFLGTRTISGRQTMFCNSVLRWVLGGPYMHGAFSEVLVSHECRFFFRLSKPIEHFASQMTTLITVLRSLLYR